MKKIPQCYAISPVAGVQAEIDKILFIGGLSHETTKESLKLYFEQWGKIIVCVLKRGYGFITNQQASQLDKAQQNRPHIIDVTEVQSNRYSRKYEQGAEEAAGTGGGAVPKRAKKAAGGKAKAKIKSKTPDDYGGTVINIARPDDISEEQELKIVAWVEDNEIIYNQATANRQFPVSI
ncbi:PREDICTED: heterogeneous nuclear ribonucleoprotein A1, A2/B1 homolog [Priapulus caudatus]|uniref:Heterogeneous nuclear ribonucleoprotein A1, A2/B1 homolog n=1 Tax=Priapulus caudatus TaxID=37621 RepID=A0ABM1EI06_PRICU|nr:PREDICTED: heterogeneous nuclear ribonucleoprotein A1, A2/B1 homolog [Priapulus caudatus]